MLFEATCEERWFEQATALADEMIARFADPEHGGFFSTASDGEQLIARRKDLEDTPIPAGGSSAALGLLRLAQLTGEAEYERHAVSVLRAAARDRPAPPDRVRTPAAGAALAPLTDAPDRLPNPSRQARLTEQDMPRAARKTGRGKRRIPRQRPSRARPPSALRR